MLAFIIFLLVSISHCNNPQLKDRHPSDKSPFPARRRVHSLWQETTQKICVSTLLASHQAWRHVPGKLPRLLQGFDVLPNLPVTYQCFFLHQLHRSGFSCVLSKSMQIPSKPSDPACSSSFCANPFCWDATQSSAILRWFSPPIVAV